jgi:hypothetical protein
VKAGVFRSAAGRQNEQHLHMQDFTLRPLLNQAYLGEDGLRPPGAQVSWLLPLPIFLRLTGEALSVAPGASPTFGGGLRSSPTFLGNVKTFASLGEAWSLFVGGTVAAGHAPPAGFTEGRTLDSNGPRTWLAGGDLYLKYMPPNHVANYFALSVAVRVFLAPHGGHWRGRAIRCWLLRTDRGPGGPALAPGGAFRSIGHSGQRHATQG